MTGKTIDLMAVLVDSLKRGEPAKASLDFPRPRSCELAEASIMAEHEQSQARVISEYEHRTPGRDVVLFTCDSTQLVQIKEVAGDLQRAGYNVGLRWIKDTERGEIIGIAICETMRGES